jgi:polyhydroxybutyrate depolymerase
VSGTRWQLARAAALFGVAGGLSGLLLAPGCSSVTPTAAEPTPSPTATPTPTPTPVAKSAGCGVQGPATGLQTLTIKVGGQKRQYAILVPSGYDPQRPLALVFVFHGAYGTVSTAMTMGLQNVTAAASSAIFLFPQGTYVDPQNPDWGNGWDESCGGSDMLFFDAMLETTAASYCVDLKHVFATGFSWGGDFVNNLACCRGDKLRAIAPASGDDAHYNAACGTKVPAFRITYGDRDPQYAQSDFADAVSFERTAHGCSSLSGAVLPLPCIGYHGCDQPVIECKYAGMGHMLPDSWAADTWDFFASFL